jgi:DNA-binding transcriptional ArsR family regulator
MTKRDAVQDDLFQADASWFHLFRAMVDSGDLARLSGSAVKVYLVVKAHVNHQTGVAFPSHETIGARAGLSVAQVKRTLIELEEAGYLVKEKAGRHNVYRTREKVEILDDAGQPAAVATWDYLPSGVRDAVAELKRVVLTGDLGGANIVNIERLQINITHAHDQAVVINAQDLDTELAKLPPGLRDALKRGIEASRKVRE